MWYQNFSSCWQWPKQNLWKLEKFSKIFSKNQCFMLQNGLKWKDFDVLAHKTPHRLFFLKLKNFENFWEFDPPNPPKFTFYCSFKKQFSEKSQKFSKTFLDSTIFHRLCQKRLSQGKEWNASRFVDHARKPELRSPRKKNYTGKSVDVRQLAKNFQITKGVSITWLDIDWI